MFQGEKYLESTKEGIRVYWNDKFANENLIENVSDFTLANYLMENKVRL